jgi:hypothetical protein
MGLLDLDFDSQRIPRDHGKVNLHLNDEGDADVSVSISFFS